MLAEILGPDILIVIAVIALVFGSTRIPKMARALGSSAREFRRGVEGEEGGEDAKRPTATTAPAVTASPAAPNAAPADIGAPPASDGAAHATQ